MTVAMAASLSATVFAANDGVSNTQVAGPNVKFDKYLLLKETANVPNATFEYEITHDESLAKDADLTNKKPQIFEGIGTPVISNQGKAVFTPSDTKNSAAQDNTSTVQTQGTHAKDIVELETGWQYAKKTLEIDFTGINFTTPGIYRYKLHEKDFEIQGISKDDTDTLYLDVYVNSDENGALSISGTVLHRNDEVLANSIDTATTFDGGFGVNQKVTGFENRYMTQDLTLEKTVTGNQGDRSRYFEFTVEIKDAIAGSVYDVDLSDAQSSVTVNGVTKTNPAQLTASNAGIVPATTFYLKDTQSIKIKGIAPTTTYKITEVIENSEGYKVTNVVSSKADTDAAYTAGESVENKVVGDITMGNKDYDVVYTNYRNSIVPTGIILQYLPYIITLIAAALAFVILGITKAKRSK